MGKASDLWKPGGSARKEEKQLEIRLISGSPTWPHPAILMCQGIAGCTELLIPSPAPRRSPSLADQCGVGREVSLTFGP